MQFEAARQREIAERIRDLRGPRPQRWLADRVGVTEKTVGNWERGNGIAWNHYEAIADAFGVEVNWLLYGDDREPAPDQLNRIERKLDQLVSALADDDGDDTLPGPPPALQDPAPTRQDSARPRRRATSRPRSASQR